jgi:hypothetical protein
MQKIETIKQLDYIHPLQDEVRHDEQSFALFELARTLETAAQEPYSEAAFNPYHKLQEVMFNYIGNPDIENRKGLHELPDSTRETRFGTRKYTLGCGAIFNPETTELCIIRKDPEAHSQDTTDWMVIRYNISNGELREEVVLGARSVSGADGDNVTLDIAPDKYYQGPYQLTFSVDSNYNATGLPATLSHRLYYGRGTEAEANRMIDQEYTDDISVLFEKVAYESQQGSVNLKLHYESKHDDEKLNQLYQHIGHIAA